MLDHRMPGLDGLETLAKFKELARQPAFPNRRTPVIALTANAISGAREEYMAAGFDDYLTKPIDSHQLETMLQKYLPSAKVRLVGHLPVQETGQQEMLPAWLEKVQGLDTRAGVQHCGSVTAYMDALTIFAQTIASGAQEIERFYNAEDWENYTTKVHALKSTARVIGAQELSEKARRLEDAGNNCYCDEIQANTQPLLELYRGFAQALAPLLPIAQDETEKLPLAPEELAEAWVSLGEVVQSFDYDSLQYLLQELAGYQLPDEAADKLAQVKAAASIPDWVALKKILQ